MSVVDEIKQITNTSFFANDALKKNSKHFLKVFSLGTKCSIDVLKVFCDAVESLIVSFSQLQISAVLLANTIQPSCGFYFFFL